MSVAQTLKQEFDAFVATPKGAHYAFNAENFPYDKIVVRCIDPRLNPILQALGLQGDHVVSIPNAGPVFPAYKEAEGRDIQASLELFAASPSVKEIYVVTHGPSCKFCGGIIYGIDMTAENLHLCQYINDSRALLSPRIDQRLGSLHSDLYPGMEKSWLPLKFGRLIRANMSTYPVMRRRTDISIYLVFIGFDPLKVLLCLPGENEYVPVSSTG